MSRYRICLYLQVLKNHLTLLKWPFLILSLFGKMESHFKILSHWPQWCNFWFCEILFEAQLMPNGAWQAQVLFICKGPKCCGAYDTCVQMFRWSSCMLTLQRTKLTWVWRDLRRAQRNLEEEQNEVFKSLPLQYGLWQSIFYRRRVRTLIRALMAWWLD